MPVESNLRLQVAGAQRPGPDGVPEWCHGKRGHSDCRLTIKHIKLEWGDDFAR
jgi:hypothetical protein